MTAFRTPIGYVKDGEPVNSGVTNRPIRDLARRVDRLKEVTEVLGPDSAQVLPDVPIEPTVITGMPVYFNPVTGRFGPGLAALEEDGSGPADSALIWGIAKVHAGLGTADIILLGIDPALTLTGAGVTELEVGEYFLSSTQPGKLTRTSGAVPVRVCVVGYNAYVYVCPKPVGPPDGHSHYAFQLTSAPAGTPTATGLHPDGSVVAEILDPDSDLPGWLPADDAVFEGNAPEGAVFGYNLSQDAALSAVWPPEPPSAASIVLYEDLYAYYGREVRSGTDGLVQFTRDGIWWMSNRAQDVPWVFPEDSQIIPASMSAALSGDRRAILYFHRSRYAAYRLTVTSLVSESPVIEVVSACDGLPATAGPLIIKYNPLYENETDSDDSPIAMKSFNGGKFRRGPIVVGLTPLDDSVTLAGGVSGPDPNNPERTRYWGALTIKFNDSPRELIISPELTKLAGSQQRYESDLLAIGMAAGTGYRMKFRLPGPSRFPPNAKASLRLCVTGNNASALPDLTVTYTRVPRSTAIAELPTAAPVAVALTMPGAVESTEYIEIESDSWTVSADDVIIVAVSRESGDGYTGEVEILDAVLRVFTPSP